MLKNQQQVDYKTFHLDELDFVDRFGRPSGWINTAVTFMLIRFTGVRETSLQVSDKADHAAAKLEVLGKAIHFGDVEAREFLRWHQQRVELWRKRWSRVFTVLFIPLAILQVMAYVAVALAFPEFFQVQPVPDEGIATLLVALVATLGGSVAIVLLLFLIMSVLLGLTSRVAFALTGKDFAESLCVRSVVELILFLSREDALTNPQIKRDLLTLTDRLARDTALVGALYGDIAKFNAGWTREHFRRMKGFIRQRERWIVAPTTTTLDTLRQDFYNLARLYIWGAYGEFEWPEEALEDEEARAEAPTFRQRLVTVLLPRLLGIVLPLVFLGVLLWQSGSVGIGETAVIAYIFIAWFLLSIDAVFNLGVVSRVVGLAREIREIT